MVPKLIILAFFGIFSVAFAESSASSESLNLDNLGSKEAEALLYFVRKLINVGYEADKLDTIAQIVSTLQEDADTLNITLVGTQNIYNADGSLKELRTVELFLPQVKNLSPSPQKADEKPFDADDYETLKEIRNGIQEISLVGLDLDLFHQTLDKNDNVESEIYLGKNLWAAKYDGMVFLNRTIKVDTVDDVKVDLEKQGPMPSSYLVFDVDGRFLKEESTVNPTELVTAISDYNEPSSEIINTCLQSLANAFLETHDRDKVPEALRQKMSEAYPDVSFVVVASEPLGAYWNKDYSVQLSYDFLDIEDGLIYTVYGYNTTITSN